MRKMRWQRLKVIIKRNDVLGTLRDMDIMCHVMYCTLSLNP